MVKINKFFICLSVLLSVCSYTWPKHVKPGENMKAKKEEFVKKQVLKNGLTVLVREVHNIPKVSIQLFYNVGSKDGKTGEKGIAHLIEHMVFKGTDKLSESDINFIVQFEEEKSLLDLAGLKLELEENTGKKVEVLTYDSLYSRLRDIILGQEISLL